MDDAIVAVVWANFYASLLFMCTVTTNTPFRFIVFVCILKKKNTLKRNFGCIDTPHLAQ
jgi:hypothetical protein